jgi:hypothetical protein
MTKRQQVYKALAQQIVESVSTSRSHFEPECRLLMPSGAIKDLYVRAHAVHHSSSDTAFVGAVSGITARKAGDAKVREQEMELPQILDLTPQTDWRVRTQLRAAPTYFPENLILTPPFIRRGDPIVLGPVPTKYVRLNMFSMPKYASMFFEIVRAIDRSATS